MSTPVTYGFEVETPKLRTSGWQRNENLSPERVMLVNMPPPASAGSGAVGSNNADEGVTIGCDARAMRTWP